jgi:RHS repeat-associated protein
LTSADGPWGELDWSYDRIGNRLSETRDSTEDTYQYLVNAGTGNTPILDQVVLGVGGTRDYTWGAAGHLEEVAAGANVLDFGADEEGRLSGVMRAAASEAAAVGYDGRSLLRRAEEAAGGTSSVEPLYESAGVVHALRRQASPTDPEELVVFFYLVGSPVAQVAIDGSGAETWTYVTADHLGTPLLATDDAGAVVWEGGFEPFGWDYQQGTPAGALENRIYLRLPGQWEDTTWGDSTSGAEIYYNVARWMQPAIARYNRIDPLGLSLEVTSYFEYGLQNPLLNTDPLGLLVVSPDANCKPKKIRQALEILNRLPTNCHCKRLFAEALGADLSELLSGPLPILKTFGSLSANAGTGGYTPCDGSGEIRIANFYCRRASPADLAQSILHELAHFADCDEQRFPPLGPIEEGGLAEVVCFGRKVDTKPVVKVPFIPLPSG